VKNGSLDKGPANILKDLVFGGYDFNSINFMSRIQSEIVDFEMSLNEKTVEK